MSVRIRQQFADPYGPVSGHVWPVDEFWFFVVFQHHHATLVVASVRVVVREGVAHVCDVLHVLSLMEVSGEHSTATCEVFGFHSARIWHLHHGVHLEVGQFEVSEHVFLRHLLDPFPFVLDHPRDDCDVVLHQPLVHDVYVGYVPYVLHGVDLSLVPVVQVMIAHYDIDLLKCLSQPFYVGHSVVHRADVRGGPVVVPIT